MVKKGEFFVSFPAVTFHRGISAQQTILEIESIWKKTTSWTIIFRPRLTYADYGAHESRYEWNFHDFSGIVIFSVFHQEFQIKYIYNMGNTLWPVKNDF